jgi:hypothetical protein
MSLIITFMFEPAKLQMNCARASGISTFRNAGDGLPVATVPATVHLPLVRRRGLVVPFSCVRPLHADKGPVRVVAPPEPP